MNQDILQSFIVDFAKTIALTGLQLEQRANLYFAKRLPTQRNQQQIKNNQKLITILLSLKNQQNKADYQSKLFEIINSEEGKIMVFQMYYGDVKHSLIQQNPDLLQKQIHDKAAGEFNGLSKREKIKYLENYINNISVDYYKIGNNINMQKYHSNQHLHAQDYDLLFNDQEYQKNVSFGYVTPFDYQGEYSINNSGLTKNNFNHFMPNNFIHDLYKKNIHQDLNNQKKWNQNGTYSQGGCYIQGEKGEGKSKNDFYKMALNQRNEKQDKLGSKNEEIKDKSQFQTLKSLYKKLQNTS